jgi:hypothetical protein
MTESNYQLESRMREIRQSGSEGGGALTRINHQTSCQARMVSDK